MFVSLCFAGDQCPLPVYGRSLEIHLSVTHAKIAYPLRQCIGALNNSAALCEEASLFLQVATH